MRVGFGYDSHRFENGKPLILGGIKLPGECGLKAHSDGDVVIHAIIDAILGAAAMGDIGSHFPDTDEKWKGANSSQLLKTIVEKIHITGYSLVNLDVTIICEHPKISPIREQMVKQLSNLLEIEPRTISIKGKTNEKLDDIGAGLGIEVHAVCLLDERK